MIIFKIVFIVLWRQSYASEQIKELGEVDCVTSITDTKCEMNETCRAHCKGQCINPNLNNCLEQDVWGSEVYTYDSPICLAAVHDLRMSTWDTSKHDVLIKRILYDGTFQGSSRFGIRTYDYEKLSNREKGSFIFLNQRVNEDILDVVSVHKRFLFNSAKGHTQRCVAATNALSRNINFNTYMDRCLAHSKLIIASEVQMREDVHDFKMKWRKSSNLISGGFQCIPENSVLSVITSVALREDAEFIPHRITVTANVNETVVLEMNRRGKCKKSVWAKDDHPIAYYNYLPEKITDTTLTIENVHVGSQGLYSLACSKNKVASRSITRLIVRVCPKGKYGKECSSKCQPCENGGVCHDITGECICPPGFNGTICQRACLPGYFGRICNMQCSTTKEGETKKGNDTCKDLLICLPDPYGCSCAAGFTGIGCNSTCKNGTYGADCNQERECHCKDKQPCNIYSGLCSSGCESHWHGPGCSLRYPTLKNSPIFVSSTISSITITFMEWDPKVDVGSGTPSSYIVFYQEFNGLMLNRTVDVSKKSRNHTITLNNLKMCTEYFIAVYVVDAISTIQSNISELNSYSRFSTLCYRADCPSAAEVIFKNATTISIRWKGPDISNGILIGYRINWTEANLFHVSQTDTSVSAFTHDVSNKFTLKGLFPATTYDLSIEALMSIGYGQPLAITVKTTSEVSIIDKEPKFISYAGSEIIIKVYPVKTGGIPVKAYFVVVIQLSSTSDIQSLGNNIYEPSTCVLNNTVKKYVAGKLDFIPYEGFFFVVGTGQCNEGYYNAPLLAGQAYRIGLTAFSFYDNEEHFTEIKFMKEQVHGPQVPEKANDMTTALCAVLALTIVIIVFVLFYNYLNFPSEKKAKSKGLVQMSAVDDQVCFGTSNAAFEQLELTETELLSEESFNHTIPILVKELEEYVLNHTNDGEIRKQFMNIPRGLAFPCTAAKIPQNRMKNRYGNHLPYDHSRVVLDILPGDLHSYYINANYIDGYNQKNKYIATQGPKTENIADFWRMVWKEKTCKILMATKMVECGKVKCEKYWPDASKIYHDIIVTLKSTECYNGFTIKTFSISKDKQMRELKHFHFHAWPDHDVPRCTVPVIKFLKKARSYQSKSDFPVIVHCSAGIGRTGTLILLDSMIEMGMAEGKVNLVNHLCIMRRQRCNILENMDQYVFVYKALVVSLCYEETAISSIALVSRIGELCTADLATGMTPLEKQFEVLTSQTIQFPDVDIREARQPYNISKNRCRDILPNERSRHILRSETGDGQSNYINAVYVDGYQEKDAFIVTQFPLPNSLSDFWQMIKDTGSRTIILLQDIDFTDYLCSKYWPNRGEVVIHGMFQIECLSVQTENDLRIWNFNLKVLGLEAQEEGLLVKLFHYHGWKIDDLLPYDVKDILYLIEKMNIQQLQLGKHPVTVQCLNGANASGVYCAATFLCNQFKVGKEIDVFEAVQYVRTNRPQFIINLVQYKFLHEIGMAFAQNFETTNNSQ